MAPLHKAASFNENPAVITALLNAGANPSASNAMGTTLHFAASFNENPAVITALLEAGADPNARDRVFSTTPLHEAAESNENPAIITVLLEAGADPKARDKKDKTPWDYAKDNEALKDSDAYWRLNDARF